MMQRQQYSPMGQPPSSPLSRSPLIGVQPPSSPLSVRSPLIAPQTTPSPSPQPDSGNSGGGNPHHNPTPLPFDFVYFKPGLRGGSPMWGQNKPIKMMSAGDSLQGSSGQQNEQGWIFVFIINLSFLKCILAIVTFLFVLIVIGLVTKPKKESHISKVSILKKKVVTKVVPAPTQNINLIKPKINPLTTLVNAEYNELDDSSCTPPISPGKIVQSLEECVKEDKILSKTMNIVDIESKIKKTKSTVEAKVLECAQHSDEEIVLIESSPDENKHQIIDYDDENDKSFVGAEVSLCAAAGDSDQGDLSVLEPFPPVEIADVASPLDPQEYVLFSDGVDYVDSDDSLKQLSFIQKDDSVVISYSRQTSESNGGSNVNSPPEGSEDESSSINVEDVPSKMQMDKLDDETIHESIDSEIVVISSNVGSPEEHIATEEDFEELIDNGKPEDSTEDDMPKEPVVEKLSIPSTEPTLTTVTRTETTKKTVAVISLATKPPQSASGMHQFKIVNTGKSGTGITRLPLISATVLSPHSNSKMLNEVSHVSTVASVSIANQTISVPVLKSINVPIVPLTSSSQGNMSPSIKKVPITISAPSLGIPISKPISSVISVISSNLNVPRMATLSPVITFTTTHSGSSPRTPIPIFTQHHIKQKLVKPTTLTISSSKLSSLAVSQDITLPAKIFEDESASPDSSLSQDDNNENESIADVVSQEKSPVKETSPVLKKIQINSSIANSISVSSQNVVNKALLHTLSVGSVSIKPKELDIENEITKHTEIPQKLSHLTKIDMSSIPKSPQKVSEKIPDHIMEGDDEKNKSNEGDVSTTPISQSSISSIVGERSVDVKSSNNTVKTSTQGKDMLFDSSVSSASDVAQDSIQISIPSPTTSQERYLDNFTLQAHNSEMNNTVSFSQKQVESIKEMFDMLHNIGGESNLYPIKLSDPINTPAQDNTVSTASSKDNDAISDIDDIIRQEMNSSMVAKSEHSQESMKSTIPVHVIMRSRESSQSPINVGTSRLTTLLPQLSPLSKPTELTTNIANASQQLRTIMSSINTSKAESAANSTVNLMRKNHTQSEINSIIQVNFENLLPSTKVEVIPSKSTNRALIEKAVMNSISNSTVDNSQSISTVAVSRMNILSAGVRQQQQSPLGSPSSSPRNSPLLSIKSPIPTPLIGPNQSIADESIQTSTPPSLQMPALSKITSSPSQIISTVIQSNNPTITSTSLLQMNQIVSTNILSSTLMQANRHVPGSNMQMPIHSISSSQPPALIMTSRPATMLSANLQSTSTSSILGASLSQAKPQVSSNIISLKLLHSQLTSPLKRSKSTDEPKSELPTAQMQPNKRHSLESVIVKSEPMDCDESLQNLESSGCKFSSLNIPQKQDESQNVLLKQLLQNSGGNSPTVTSVACRSSVPSLLGRTAPSLGLVPSLEAQLARPSIPPPHLPVVTSVEPPKTSPRQTPVSNPPFTSRPPQPTLTIPVSSVPIMTQSSTQSLMDVRKPLSKLIVREDSPLNSTPITPSTPSPFCMTPTEQLPQTIKKEVMLPQQSPVNQSPFALLEVKKELLDESSQQSAISGVSAASDQCKLDTPLKEELSDTPMGLDNSIDSVMNQESVVEARKRKRREYQQKRRQMQNNQKIEASNTKKRPRKGSRVEEDYDTFIDNLLIQLRLLPALQIQEPMLCKNYGVCPVFGSGDLSKIGVSRDYNIQFGDLSGEFGSAKIPNTADFYNTKPFGEDDPIPEKPPASTQRGFYDQEFSPIRLENDLDDKKIEFVCKERDVETPDTIVSSSSPECCLRECSYQFPGLRLIDESESDEEIERSKSPVIPIITPVPIRLKPLPLHFAAKDIDKENIRSNFNKDNVCIKSKVLSTGVNAENEENITVTLTLTSSAAEDILNVLRELAGILHIPPPTTYQIVERTTTPPSHKLGLYRSKGRDGKEGMPIDIQSILNGATKFCRHCDIVILDSVIRAKPSEFPLLSSSNNLLSDGENDLYFCSTQCYKRFAWTPTNILADNKLNNTKMESEDSLISNVDIKDKDEFDMPSAESMDTEDIDIKPDIKGEKMDLSFMDATDDLTKDNETLQSEIIAENIEDSVKQELSEDDSSGPPVKVFRGLQYKYWSPGCIAPPTRYKRPTDREIIEMVFRTGVTVMPARMPEDVRRCSLCHAQGDGVADGPARLLNYDVDKWVHLNCALWSDGVYETVNGALMNFDNALQLCTTSQCVFCERTGATVRCFKTRCSNVYHLSCAVKDKCVFHKNKTAHCPSHLPKGEKENELTTLSVQRRVYVQRDESRQVAAVMQLAEPTYLLRVGSLIFLSVGQLLPHQLPAFHTPHFIYPIGFQIVSTNIR